MIDDLSKFDCTVPIKKNAPAVTEPFALIFGPMNSKLPETHDGKEFVAKTSYNFLEFKHIKRSSCYNCEGAGILDFPEYLIEPKEIFLWTLCLRKQILIS